MLKISEETLNIINSPVRKIEARVDLYTVEGEETEAAAGATLVDSFTHDGDLKEFKVDRVGDESKFFGFGIFQKINVKVLDINKEKNINTNNYLKVVYSVNGEEITPFPMFKVSETHRDEITNELSITAYDELQTIKDLPIPVDSIKEFMTSCIEHPGYHNECNMASLVYYIVEDLLGFEFDGNTIGDWISMAYTNIDDINIDGSETYKQLLDALAEVSHSIYFINGNGFMVFESLYEYGNVGREYLDKSKYFDLDTKENRRLSTVIHTTELGNNITTPATTGNTGTTQYLKDNLFIDKNEDKAILILNDIIDALGDFTIGQFTCEWRGNPALEPLDKLIITTKDDTTIESFVINETIEYNGSLKHKTSWNYQEAEEEETGAPTTLGEALKLTQAKVDKVNQEISLVVKTVDEGLTSANDRLDGLTQEVSLKLDKEAVNIEITQAVENVNSITTTTGFKFNEDGLTISKSDTDITTTITEDGMVVRQGEDEKLVADNEGVKAEDLHATTYLIIGKNSRFEDYTNAEGVAKTACFWIGGNA